MSAFTSVRDAPAHPSAKLVDPDSHRPLLSAAFVAAADVVAVRITLWALFGDNPVGRFVAPGSWLGSWLLVPFFLLTYFLFGLYPGLSVSPVDEVRRALRANLTAFIGVSVLIVSHGGSLI